MNQQGGGADRCNESVSACQPFPGDIEGRAVTGAGSNHGQAERDIHGVFEADQFEGDMTLIVIHGCNPIELTVNRAAEQCVRWKRPAGKNSAFLSRLHGR